METIKVNMSPNPLDVQTIHASQNDGEARQWEFELHNNGELIDTSDVKEQLVFKAYKGGTEQLLPENGSTPTTSPFLGDIKYPQGLLTDQEFLYRQSPTEEDGNAKIKNLYGNTLTWNQLASVLPQTQEYEYGLTFTNNNDGSITINGTCTNTGARHPAVISGNSNIEWLTTHIYLINFANTSMTLAIRPASAYTFESGALTNGIGIFKPNSDSVGGLCIRINANSSMVFDNYRIYPQVFDLTKMFGEAKANEIYAMEQTQTGSGVAYFRSLFPLSYYSYNQGSLLSFMGNGIKTTGKNLIKPSFVDDTIQGVSYKYNADGSITCSGHSTANTSQFALQPERSANIVRGAYYFLSGGNDQVRLRITTFDSSGTVVRRNNASTATGNLRMMFNDDEVEYNVTAFPATANIDIDCTIYPQFEISYDKTSREPYAESTLSLPISTYFPDGMQGHGDTYDELTSAVATKNFEKNSLGDLTWARRATNIFSANLPSEFDASKDISCFMSNRMPTVFVSGYTLAEDGYISIYKTTTVTSSTSIYLNMASQSIDTVADLQTWLSNNPTELVYPLATPTETPITTASLVTENAEIPLSNEDGVLIGKCTEQLSENPGFIDAKIKLSDSDGECYSNKIQLHVERSPQ